MHAIAVHVIVHAAHAHRAALLPGAERLGVELAVVGRSYEGQRAALDETGRKRLRLIVACHQAGYSLRHIAQLARLHFTTVRAIVEAHADDPPADPGPASVTAGDVQALLDEMRIVVGGAVDGVPLASPEHTYTFAVILQRALDNRAALRAEDVQTLLRVLDGAEIWQIARRGHDPMGERRIHWRAILTRLHAEVLMDAQHAANSSDHSPNSHD